MVKYLNKNYNIDVNANYNEELELSAVDNNLKIAKYLVKWGAKVDGNDALMFSAHYGNYEVVKYLIEEGADVDFNNETLNDAPDFSCDTGEVEASKFLLQSI